VVLQVLSALDAVHAQGIVHRDVKPGNVFLCAGGAVKLLDFGVAKILGEASVKHLAPAYRTKEGSLVGTPKYMTPEQAYGEPVDARTDVYAAGLLLYALVTGRHAFEGEHDVVEIVAAMRDRGARPPSARAPQAIPAGLDAAVMKALAWSASARFQSAAAFAVALRAIDGSFEDLDEPTHVLSPERAIPRPVLGLVLVLSAALGLWLALLVTGGPG
jgi:serine/threonine-protein kinase